MPESATDRPTNGHEKIYLLSKSKDYFYDEQAVAQPIADMSRVGEVRGDTGHSRRDVDKANRITEGSGVMTSTKKLRNVWTFNPATFAKEHFATYPVELIEPCIKAGSSSYGVCSECKAPYERVTERVETGHDGSEYGKRHVEANAQDGTWENSTLGSSGGSPGTANKQTVGWEPTCDCDADVEPTTVLDPFNGAATTGIAALKHGRQYIGIDVNEDYIELSKNRLREHSDVPTEHSFW